MEKQKKIKNLNYNQDKTRAKYKCPEELENLILMRNKFHPEGLSDFSEYENRVKQKFSKDEYLNFTQEEIFKLGVSEILEDLGKRAGWFVIGALQQAWAYVERLPEGNTTDDILPPDVVFAFIGVYVNFKSDIDNLTELANELNDIRKGKKTSSDIEVKRFGATLIPTLSESGILKMRTNTRFFDAVDGIIADRLRICEICNQIFWAKREESETCSAQCFNNLRVRRYRNLTDEEKAERKAKREENKKRNIELKQIKENNNATL